MFRVATSTATPKIITPLISAFVKHIEIGVGLAEIHLEMLKGKPENDSNRSNISLPTRGAVSNVNAL